jgi:thiamine pyrophosphate-dependent acetolactate synthase large subunit-like protein
MTNKALKRDMTDGSTAARAHQIRPAMAEACTVHDVTYELLCVLGLTTVFGNPGSTEQPFLQNFPEDFTYVLALQEASVLAIADGFAQSTGKPALVNIHTAAGTGNAMGNLVTAFGPEVDRSGGWDAGVAFAEKVRAGVYADPLPDRVSFPEDHPLYQGQLPMTIAGVNQVLRGHDLVVVIGAQVFRYYPYVAGEYLPQGTQLLHITSDPDLAGRAPVGESLLGDTRLALQRLADLVAEPSERCAPAPVVRKPDLPESPNSPLTPAEVHATLSALRPADSVLVTESTSTMAEQREWLPTTRPGSFYATASGGIGWGVPAAVGVALGHRARGETRTVLATIGDGSFQYSVQAVWTAAQHKLPIVFVVMRNEEYAILKSFAVLEQTPGVPGLDLPGLDITSLATGFGCRAVHADTTEELTKQFTSALAAEGPTVIEVRTQPRWPISAEIAPSRSRRTPRCPVDAAGAGRVRQGAGRVPGPLRSRFHAADLHPPRALQLRAGPTGDRRRVRPEVG